MNRWSRLILAIAATAASASSQTASQGTPHKSDEVFKNIRVLKGIPLDDFMGGMGVMSAALGIDCSECHIGAGTEKVDWAADTPRKAIARSMVLMMNNLNKNSFAGKQVVTCWTCHRGRDRPFVTPTLEAVYGAGSQEMDDVLTQQEGQPAGNVILDRYVEAVGGARRLAGLKSYAAKGTSVSFGGFGKGGRVQIYAKFPDQRATIIDFPEEPERGNSFRIFDGHTAWLKTPLTVLGEYELTGGELDGARLDAELSFPGQIKEVLGNPRVSLPTTISDLPGPSSQTSGESSTETAGKDRLVNVLQGTGRRGALATLYFAQDSGLLLRMVRLASSPVGRVPTQIDYGDYRDVGGIKIPFRVILGWLDGRDAIQLSEVRINVPIDNAKFGRPAPVKAR